MTVALKTMACGIALLLACAEHARAQTLNDLLRRGCALQHAVVPIYSQPNRQLSTLVRVDKACVDYQRKGFFHIGILPVAALEGVTFEVRQAASASSTLAQLQGWLGGNSSRVELSRVKFVFQTNSLEAGRVQVRSHDQWELLDGVRLLSGAHEVRAERATIRVSGEHAGQVILEDEQRTTTVFLGLKQL